MKLKIILLIFCLQFANAQSYQKDWDQLNKKIEEGAVVTANDLKQFIKRYQKELPKFPDNSTQLFSLLANTEFNSGNHKAAEDNYLEAYKYAVLASDTSLKHIVELNLAIFCYNTNKLVEAERYYLKCLPGMAAIYGQSSREYTQLFYDYTRLLIDLGKYEQADPYVDALLYYYKTLDGENNLRYRGLQSCKAIVYQNKGNYQAAAEIMEQLVAEKSVLTLGDTLGYVISISNLGDLYREIGQYESAVTYLKQAKRLYYELNIRESQETLATIANNLALCYKATGEYPDAEQNYNLALEIYRQNKQTDTEPYCTALSNKADLYRGLGRFGEASGLLLEAIGIRKERFSTLSENYANALSNLASVYFDVEYYDLALEKNLEAKTVYEQTVGENHQSYANCMNSLSLCYLYIKDYKLAEAYKLKALRIIEQTVGKSHYRYSSYLISTYGLYKQMQQLDKAQKNMEEALELIAKNFGRRHELYANALLALAEIKATQGKFDEAGNLYKESLNYYAAQVNDYFDAMGEEDQMSFLASISSAFESYNIFVLNYKYSNSSLDISEHLKACLQYQLLLKSLLASRSAQIRSEMEKSNDPELKRLYREWLGLKTELINRYKSQAAANGDDNELVSRIQQLEVQIKARSKGFSEPELASFETLKNHLRINEAAIEVFKVREKMNDSISVVKYGLLVIKAGLKAPELFIFNNGDQLDQSAFQSYARAVEEAKPDTISYISYFKPLEQALRGIDRIYLSPDGVFNKISLAGLYDPIKKKYMGETYTTILVSNLSAIVRSPARNAQGKTAALFGYPDYDYDFKLAAVSKSPSSSASVAKRYGLVNLPKLPGTKAEVELISSELKAAKWDVDLFTEQMASEQNIKKVNSPAVLHIATHGYYLKDVETDDAFFLGFENSRIKNNSLLRSGLILAGAGPATQDSSNHDSGNDGILTAYEASFLNLQNTDLVVLSACQTGLGDEIGTEGVAGLQRSLAIAGAKNLIMSLWPVDDFATQLLMTEFYKTFAQTRNVETSFVKAQVAVKNKYHHPAYWAAFVLLKTFN